MENIDVAAQVHDTLSIPWLQVRNNEFLLQICLNYVVAENNAPVNVNPPYPPTPPGDYQGILTR